MLFGVEKLEWFGYRQWKNFEDTIRPTPFDRIHGHTHRDTQTHTHEHRIGRACIASRGKKCTCVTLGVTHFVNSSQLRRDRWHEMAQTVRHLAVLRDFVPLKWHDLARLIAEHCGNKIRASVRLAFYKQAKWRDCIIENGRGTDWNRTCSFWWRRLHARSSADVNSGLRWPVE